VSLVLQLQRCRNSDNQLKAGLSHRLVLTLNNINLVTWLSFECFKSTTAEQSGGEASAVVNAGPAAVVRWAVIKQAGQIWTSCMYLHYLDLFKLKAAHS
jgi:hypothetical protein